MSGGGRQEFLFVRRPGLCLGAFFGTRATSLVHAGLGFLWHPRAGMVVHSLNGDGGCWSTRLPDGRLDADGDLTAEYSRNVAPGQPFTVRYRTADSAVGTQITVSRQSLRRVVTTASAATEETPLVVHPTDRLTFTDGTEAAHGATGA